MLHVSHIISKGQPVVLLSDEGDVIELQGGGVTFIESTFKGLITSDIENRSVS